MGFRSIDQAREIETSSIRRQDVLCLFLYYLGFSRFRSLIYRSRRIPVARILAFHDVSRYQVRCFREKLEIIKEMANVVSLDDIITGRMSWRKINIAITFDDGNRDWLDNICPVLKDLGMSATFFVSSGLVGLQEEEELDFLRNNLKSNRQTTGGLPAVELLKLAREGFAVGGHTCNHVNLSEVCDISEIRAEIQEDKKELERITGKKVEYFAYPFGLFGNARIDLEQIIRESGYRGAVTLVPGLINASTNRYYMHRDLVNASMPLSVFKARLLGNHDAVMIVRKLLRLKVHCSLA